MGCEADRFGRGARLPSLIAVAPVAAGEAAREQAKAYLRIGHEVDDALIDQLMAAAIGHGEGFTGQQLIARTVDETIAPCARWTRLGRSPVSAMEAVSLLPVEPGGETPLAVDGYAIDIDAAGDGWIRIVAATQARVRVQYRAGIAADWAGLPEALRHGAIRLAAHLYSHRDAADEGAPPAAVAALWRPWRRMRLA
jgi:uncharacterized phiE125 gp8 family phage protein